MRPSSEKKPLGLGLSWRAGSLLYRSVGWVDRTHAARDWESALAWAANVSPERPIRELQYWGHGKSGRALIDHDVLDGRVLQPRHQLRRRLEALRERMTRDSVIWFRTCETFGAQAGHDFARALGDFMGVCVAGHSYEIGCFQSGLRTLSPGCAPHWEATEGIARGTAHAPYSKHLARSEVFLSFSG